MNFLIFISVWFLGWIFLNYFRKSGKFWEYLTVFLDIRDKKIIEQMSKQKHVNIEPNPKDFKSHVDNW